jgi:hypothetical protein
LWAPSWLLFYRAVTQTHTNMTAVTLGTRVRINQLITAFTHFYSAPSPKRLGNLRQPSAVHLFEDVSEHMDPIELQSAATCFALERNNLYRIMKDHILLSQLHLPHPSFTNYSTLWSDLGLSISIHTERTDFKYTVIRHTHLTILETHHNVARSSITLFSLFQPREHIRGAPFRYECIGSVGGMSICFDIG